MALCQPDQPPIQKFRIFEVQGFGLSALVDASLQVCGINTFTTNAVVTCEAIESNTGR